MTTWKTGRRLVAERLTARAIPLDEFIATVAAVQPVRVPGTAVFMTAQPTGTPPALAHNLRYNKVLHEHVVVLTVSTAQQPHVPAEERVSVEPLGHDLFNVRVQYGFMEDPDVPAALLQAREQGLPLDLDDLTYFLGRETIIVTRRQGHGDLAREAVRPDGAQRGPRDGVLPAAARAGRRAGRAGRDVALLTCNLPSPLFVREGDMPRLPPILRRFTRAPMFTAIALITLAIGIGANTAVFSVVNGVLIKPLPYPDAEELVGIWHSAPGVGLQGRHGQHLADACSSPIARRAGRFSDFGLWSSGGVDRHRCCPSPSRCGPCP